ncbi:hypothetical protein HY570_00490 [Candidatus Micrarchaeota archaeon]|nr:hypothetical protein [Candidatus Micrarchaeota archaeon]
MEEVGISREAKKKEIASRGIPSSESLYFPAHYSEEIRAFQEKDETLTRNLWSLEEVLNFIFPKKYQAVYFQTALKFMQLMVEHNSVRGSDMSTFITGNAISKATFYNKVLPKLKRAGILKVERETIVAVESKRKYRPMTVSLSKTFGNYLTKISDSWLAIVDDVRSRKKTDAVGKV